MTSMPDPSPASGDLPSLTAALAATPQTKGGYFEVGWRTRGLFSSGLGCTYREGGTCCSAIPAVLVMHVDERRWDGDALCCGHLLEVLTGDDGGATS